MNWISWLILILILLPLIILFFRIIATIVSGICAIVGVALIVTGSFWAGVGTLVIALIAGIFALDPDPNRNIWWM